MKNILMNDWWIRILVCLSVLNSSLNKKKYRLVQVQSTCRWQMPFKKWILCFNPFPNKPWFLQVCSTDFENTVGKGEIARNEQFILFVQCFLPDRRTFCHFHLIWNCRLYTLSIWKSPIFVVWEGLKGWKHWGKRKRILVTGVFSFDYSLNHFLSANVLKLCKSKICIAELKSNKTIF